MKKSKINSKNNKFKNKTLFDFWERTQKRKLNLSDDFQDCSQVLKYKDPNLIFLRSTFFKNIIHKTKNDNSILKFRKESFLLKNFSFCDHEISNFELLNDECNQERKKKINYHNEALSNKFICPICFQYFIGQEEFDIHINGCLYKVKEFDLKYNNNIDKNMVFTSKSSDIEINFLTQENKTDTLRRILSLEIFENQIQQKKKISNKNCPFYKIIPYIGFSVDAFEFGKIEGCTGYFLSHFHSDHYKGLTSNWNNGLIYCSKITGNLVISQLKVNPKYIIKLPMNEEVLLNNVRVTLIDANHCPGSVMFVFEIMKSGKIIRYLHSGDFRASPLQISHPSIKNKCFDFLYLDTTYLDPKYSFPSQEDVINAVVQLCKILNKNFINNNDFSEKKKLLTLDNFLITTNITHKNNCRLLIVVGTYIVGKEKLALEIACSLKSKIYANQRQREIISYFENEKLSSLLTNDPKEASVHLINFRNMSVKTLNQYLIEQKPYFSKIVGFKATGRFYVSKSWSKQFSNIYTMIKNWKIFYDYTMIRPSKDSTNISICYYVPYSEHSSFKELICFCLSINVKKILPTVNIHTEKSINFIEKWFNLLEDQKKKYGLFFLPSDQKTW
ncbi:DNA cross-link repair protein PSO2 [Pneumocystis jirovecii RU7]|uniref:DNA repair metallo-beta-lactamase domain-containing protein n=1 Tax=Pneumocystis jirovecii (strain RU7) TaxID=1408657 RepID=A0A0W4ZR86_PNEJ7|nr:DNA cross-link repair protein PSO2 [Pneumocystis jirovecii RU7]KTW30881.1 hypothetical protein T551_01433 [Pneumocystis jirovecii RU7]